MFDNECKKTKLESELNYDFRGTLMGYSSSPFRCSKVGLFAMFVYLLLMALPHAVFAQDEFEKWKQAQQAEFQEYKDKFDQEFIEMLEKTWKEVGIDKGSAFYKEEKPIVIPAAPPKPTVNYTAPPDAPPIKEYINLDIPELIDVPIKIIEMPEETTLFEGLQTNRASLYYFSTTIPVEYPQKLREFFGPNHFNETDNKKIADFWNKVSSIDHTPLIRYTENIRAELGLNDWGFVLLLNEISTAVYQGYGDKAISLYNWFLLTKAGYKVRVGYDQNGIYTLFATAHGIYNTLYYTLDGERYYLININGQGLEPNSLFTYEGSHQSQSKLLDLHLQQMPVLGDGEATVHKTLSFTYNGTDYSIPVSIDKNLISYFEYFPVTDLKVFFRASLSDNSKNALYKVLAPAVAEMNEWDAVNFLLRFVQTAFAYKTDQDNFNREKYMMPDETLFYDYSDCDDRAILFASLVQDLLNMEVVGLRYSRHLATAVKFNEDISGDAHHYMGKKYIVADPTYINADVGMTMRQYQNEKPEIVSF